MIYKKERKEIAFTMRRLYRQNLTTCSGGNISLRVGNNHMLITPSGLDKGEISFRQIALMTLDGENLSIGLKPSIETDMHLKILRSRPDVNTVVHAHPVHASFFSATDSTVRTDLLAEARYLLEEPAFAPYALMGTEGLGDRVSAALEKDKSAVFLENHGVLTVGSSLLQAFDRMEVLEAAAVMTLMSRQVEGVSELTGERLKEIDRLHN